MYFQKITVQISQCLLLEMRHLLLRMDNVFQPSFKRKILRCVSAELPNCSKELPQEGSAPRRGGASRLAVHMKEGGRAPQDWLLLHI